jgi:hypothetical protein
MKKAFLIAALACQFTLTGFAQIHSSSPLGQRRPKPAQPEPLQDKYCVASQWINFEVVKKQEIMTD